MGLDGPGALGKIVQHQSLSSKKTKMADEGVRKMVTSEVVTLEKGLDLIHKTPLCPENQVYVSSLAQSSVQGMLAAGGSDGTIRCYNYDSFTSLVELKSHSQTSITGLEFIPHQTQVLWSASGTCLSSWDIRSRETTPIKTLESPNSSHFTCCSVNCAGNTIAAGTEKIDDDACIFLWDVRKLDAPLMTIEDSHEDDIIQVKFHPSRAHEMVSGSTDGLSCVFDIAKENEDEALLSVLNSGSSVWNIFSTESGRVLWKEPKQTVLHNTYRNTTAVGCFRGFTFSNLASLGSGPVNYKSHWSSDNKIFSKLESLDYLVNCFWHDESQDLYLIGGSHSGSMQVFQVMDNKLERTCLLRGGHSATVRCCLWDGQKLATGGEDSIVCCWAPESRKGGLVKSGHKNGKVLSGAMDKLKVHGAKPYEKHRRKKRK